MTSQFLYKRRAFITLLGGAAAAWPLGARAQQAEPMRRIGVLMAQAADDPEGHARIAAFAQGLQEAGWTTGRNVRIDYRWAGASADATAKYAAELVALAPDVILAATSRSVAELQRITRTIPIVFVQTVDPVSAGLVASLAHPGSNATGFTVFEYGISGKWLELLKEIAPRVTRAAVIRDPTAAPRSAWWARSNRSRRRSGWSCARSRHVRPARSSARSRCSRAPAMGA
jgi:putative ABC transport system substrate-binding protein